MGGRPARTGVRKRRLTVGWKMDCFGFAQCGRSGCGPSTGQRAVSRSGTRGRGLSVRGRSPVRRSGCAPANRAPKGANPEKMFDARGLPRLCPPHTGPARVEPRPGERGAAPDKGLGKRSICHPYVPPAYRFYASEPGEMSRLKFNVFCGLSCVLATVSRGIARGSSGTLSLRFVFV
jgi:hypothetical protein